MDKIIAFVDSVGRTIIGRVSSETKARLTVTNPAVVNMSVQQDNGQISVQLLPFIFTEFVHESVRNEVTWNFNKSNITISDNLKLDDRILQQYVQIIESPAPQAPAAASTDNSSETAEAVQLFDDE
jgi:hypothetical protein